MYGTAAGADAYHLARGNTSWTGTDAVKEAALLRASEYIDATYRNVFQGYKTGGRAQVREWPRKDAYVLDGSVIETLPDDEIPTEVLNATYEAALRELGSPGYLTPDVIPGANKKSVAVSGAVSVQYWSDDQKPMIEKIGMTLSPLFIGVVSAGNPLSGKVTIA